MFDKLGKITIGISSAAFGDVSRKLIPGQNA